MTKISFGYNQDYLGYGLLIEAVACALSFFYPFIFVPIALLAISLFLVKTDVHFCAKTNRFRFVKSLFHKFSIGQWQAVNSSHVYSIVQYASATGMSMRGSARTVVRTKTFIFTITNSEGKKTEVYEFTDVEHARRFRHAFEKVFCLKVQINTSR